ncbi:MAG: ATP-binding protein [Candidatus Omnitrophica bacterium]|nr:ATP-binding protein [Candidatus Omnitrophota bacterium]
MTKPKDRKLQTAFTALIFLTLSVGLIGIYQIQLSSKRIEELGSRHLKLEKAVLEMRVNNTIYAMGIRNYAIWKISRYLGAVPMAANLESVIAAGEKFKERLSIYEQISYLPEQKQWAEQIKSYFAEFYNRGRQILDMSNLEQTPKTEAAINQALMAFDSHLYKIDEFLNNTMGKSSLEEIEGQMKKAEAEKNWAILFLTIILLIAVGTGALIAFVVYLRLQEERRRREKLFTQMINIEETERRNLSTAVHDEMGQDLSGLKIYLGLIEQNLSASLTEAKEKIEQAKKIVSGLIEKSHNIAFLLRPPDLDEVGLVESLESLILEYKHLTDINYNYQKPKESLALPPQYSLLLYRIAQELLTNMVKYAQARNVEVRLEKNNEKVNFSYRDDGLGFDYSAIQNVPRRRKEDKLKLGLVSLKERVELLDGSMQIDSAPGKGTRVAVQLPITENGDYDYHCR